MNEQYQDLNKTLSAMPSGLPFHLESLTAAGHLYAEGYAVCEKPLHDEGLYGCALIFTPVTVENEEKELIGYLNMMYEIRANTLLTMQQAAEECGVDDRTIQRWLDEEKIPPVTIKGKQFFPSEIIKDYAAKQGHLPGRVCWR